MANELSKLIHSAALENVKKVAALYNNDVFTDVAKDKLIFTDDHHMIINGIDYLSRFTSTSDGLVAAPTADNTSTEKAGAATLLLGGDGKWYTLDENKYTNSWRAISINGNSISQKALSLSGSTTSAVSLTAVANATDAAYTIDLGKATDSLYGGIKTGFTTNASNGQYAVTLSEDGKAYVDLGGNGRYRAVTINGGETALTSESTTALNFVNTTKSGIGISYKNGINIELHTAAADELGGIKVGYTTDADKRNFAVELDSTSSAAYVNVPFVNTLLGTTSTTGNVMTAVAETVSEDGFTRTITPTYAGLATLQLTGLPSTQDNIGTGIVANDTLGGAIKKIENSIKAINATATGAMTFQGAVDEIPTTGVTNGDTYRLTSNITSPVEAKIGDAVVWVKPSSDVEGKWVVIPAGDEVGYATFTGNNGSSTAATKEATIQIVGATNSVISTTIAQGTITINHANPTTANTALTDQTDTAIAANGGTFKLPYFTVDTAGHVNGLTEKTFTLSQTWRAISVGGTQLLGDSVSTAVNFSGVGGATVQSSQDGAGVVIGSKYASFKISGQTVATADRTEELKFTNTFVDTTNGLDLMWTEIGDGGAISYF